MGIRLPQGHHYALMDGALASDFSVCANFSDATHHTVYYSHGRDALPRSLP